MSSSNKGQHRPPFSDLERKEIAQNYLVYGTFRNVEKNTEVSKTAAHKIVRDFIDKKGVDNSKELKKLIKELKALIEKNKAEAPRRGGKRPKPRRKKVK